MGTLSDITAQATNTIKRPSHSLAGYQMLQSPAGMEKENLGKSSPHFMTPTYSSSKQSAAVHGKSERKSSPPASHKPIKGESSNAWMKSAAKRVGFRRTGDGTPRSKKETPAKQPKAISFPDKFATPSRGMVPDSPPSSEKAQPMKVSPKDKPLPNPPIVQVASSASSIESKSLIDASDRPLRRSPNGLKDHEEDWPVLQPRQSASPGTLQEMMRETGAQLSQQAVSSQKERYPILGNTLRQVADEHLPISRYSVTYPPTHTELSFALDAETKPEKEKEKASAPKRTSLDDDPFRDGVYNKDLTSPPKPKTMSPSKFSASAPTGGNPGKPAIEPRQNRTSSLRARLSAGHVIDNGQSKVVGFTDFTASNKPTTGTDRKDSLRARKETQARRSITPPVAPSLHNRSSKDSLGASRAPAQFVAGSRRPAHPRRPSSRGSLRNEARGPSPPLTYMIPSRPAPARPESGDGTTILAKSVQQKLPSPSHKQHTSSVPVCRKITPDATKTGNKAATLLQSEPNGAKSTPLNLEARDESNIYNDHFPQDLINELEATPPRDATTRPVPFLIDNKDSHALEAIEESPQHAYHFKRLSMHSPEYGPTLRISPAAERFIMGPDHNKENRLLQKKSSKEIGRAMKKDDLKSRKCNTTPPLLMKKQPERPSSSQGLSRMGSRNGLIDTKAREKKVKSEDLSVASPKIPERSAERVRQRPQSKEADMSATASKASVSTSTDPFFDALEEPQSNYNEGAASDQTETGTHKQSTNAEESWILPLVVKKEDNHAANDSSLAALRKGSEEDRDLETPKPKELDTSQNNDTAAQGYAQPAQHEKTAQRDVLPSTPQQFDANVGRHSGSHPPRNSSRQAPPDWSGNKKSPSPPTAEKVPPPTPPKDFRRREINLGPVQVQAASQVELSSTMSKRDSRRESTPRESYKSQQPPMSKGNSVLSNLKGLFNKRSSDNEPTKSATEGKSNKSKVSINNDGSPFPTLSEIHPIYRPTLASTNRSKANTTSTPRNSTTTPAIPPPATPSLASPAPTSVSTTTTMAMQILDSARNERSSPKKERLLELGKIMVEGITQARNAEKAAEEAKQAARRAEVAQAMCQKTLREVGRCVQEWKEDGRVNGKL